MKTIKLNHPFDFNGSRVETVKMRRPKGKDLKKLERSEGGDMEKSLVLLSLLSGLTLEIIEEIDANDLTRLSQEVANFLEK